jgi:hypothetical protein
VAVAVTTPGRRSTSQGHAAADTMGLLLAVLVTAASVQDRDAARPLERSP